MVPARFFASASLVTGPGYTRSAWQMEVASAPLPLRRKPPPGASLRYELLAPAADPWLEKIRFMTASTRPKMRFSLNPLAQASR